SQSHHRSGYHENLPGCLVRKTTMSFFLQEKVDWKKHNEEVAFVWEAYHQGQPYRVPITVSGSIRNLFANPVLNTTGYTFQDFFTNPEAQITCQLVYQKWVRYNLLCDQMMGPPENGWQLSVDFQNSYEAGWMGCPLRFWGDQVPDTEPILAEKKEKLYELTAPDPLRGNLLGQAMEFFEYMHHRCAGIEFEGKPVLPPLTIPGEGTDGPFDLAYKLRGAANLCLDMLTDETYFHDLMEFVTTNIIRRMKAIRQWRWERNPESPDAGQFKRSGFGFADDAVALLSLNQYREFVFPYHKRLVEEFSDGGPISIHLCGNASHLFLFLKDNLRVMDFDTGFPIDFGRLRKTLGPEVQIRGGPTVMLLKNGSPDEIWQEVEHICQSGIMEGGRFILREANNLAPCTPIENIVAMYQAGKKFGRYQRY
ncbi:MAG: hypothetical protein NC911_07635, partial [Candidatus Omnitrophica bacterium]|nr:hypothetical protein [Candidatus Omnitrophota bacterium]